MAQNRFQWEVHPVALPENICRGECYRFTVLTPSLLRLEYHSRGSFEDRASQSAFHRNFPANTYTVTRQAGKLCLETEALLLTYEENAPFTAETLQIRLKTEPASTWRFGEDFDDLGGTTKTLDEVNGGRPLERGVCSRGGFSVLDDSSSLMLEEDGWIGVREEGGQDHYFFGYGFDYLGAVQALYRLTGVPPMLPAYALGNWWSRYHAYTQQEYCELMARFRREDIPFSVAVIDMDWHVTRIPEELQEKDGPQEGYSNMVNGWTGYSWNKELFPDYKAFLKELKEHDLHTSLNLHPHAGVCRHEDMYAEMATACGIDPASGKRVALDILNRDFMEKYFDIIHHPYEEAGVDFWWMDWQQGTSYWWIHEANKPGEYQDPRERMDPLWMLNHLHILDISRSGKRPMFFSRYAGPGSQRYPVGFSGDSFVTWKSLKFQPYFTATASNIGYSWWSHDIGGHQQGYRDDEMLVRWVQLGVLSPVMRLHSMSSQFQRKEPWCYGSEAEGILKYWLRLRHQLFPYLYTMNYRNHEELIPMIRPMYYSHPKQNGAYEVPNQYWFGSELIVSPITEKRDPHSRLAAAEAWLPRGNWFDFFTGLRYASRRGRKLQLHRPLGTTPLLARAGAIVPLTRYAPGENRLLNGQRMVLTVFPGGDNSFTLYEDGGEGYAFEKGAFAKTEFRLSYGEKAVLHIAPARGDLSLIPESRSWEIALRGWHRDIRVAVTVDGQTVECHCRYEAESNTTYVTVAAAVSAGICLEITGEKLLHDNGDVPERCEELLQKAQIFNEWKNHIMDVIRGEGSVHHKIFRITGRMQEADGVVAAVEELLTLTEDEYLGSQEL